jgi:hypothetical protein
VTDFIYEASVALDPSQGGGVLVRSATGQVYAKSDTALGSPLLVRGVAGEEKTSIVSSSQGVIEAFVVVDHAEVIWVSGPYAVALSSVTGLKQSAEDSAQASVTAAVAAQEANTKAFKIGRPGAVVPTWWGEFNSSNEPTAAEGAVAGDLGVLLS